MSDVNKIRGLIFDFDGLILETEGPIYQSWQELFKSFGASISMEVWADYIGAAEDTFDPFDELARQTGRDVDRESLAGPRRRRETELVLGLPVLPGVEDYLETGRSLGLKIALASSSSCAWVNGHLSRLGLLDYFDHILASDDVQRTKPDPELFLLALERLGLPSEEAIVFEDSPNGVLAANRAGIFAVAVPNMLTRQLPLEHADLRLDSLVDLPLEDLLVVVNRSIQV